MNLGHFSIDRPRFAAVLSIFVILMGIIAYGSLPVSQYPEVAPPTIVVRAVYPGATSEIVADTVATPIEQEVNGVEGMLYMQSSSTSDGAMQLTVTFALGTDLDNAQVLVQNRVAAAEPRLPEEVRRLGIITQKSSPDLMMVVHLLSPDDTFDQLYISNYALLQIRDVLARVDGVGNITVFGAREYSMRVWLNPDRLSQLNLTASDVVAALRSQNVQVAGGSLGQPPLDSDRGFQYTVNTQGRFTNAQQFREVIVASGNDGRLVRLGDVARVALGARDYVTNSYLDTDPAVAMAIFQRPGSNALQTADEILSTMDTLKASFPEGLEYQVVYNPTEFVAESVSAVYTTIIEAVLLVVLVILVFLQDWRAALIPIAAIPVSLIGTFAVMAGFGFSLNNLSLFGLVLAIGIVVDDAIVVVENIERNMEQGKSPREAARVTMSEVGSALISIALVLSAVFIPAAFLGGISGQFFRQFAVTIASATLISALNSLTLSPALGAMLMRPKGSDNSAFGRLWEKLLGGFFRLFNRNFDRLATGYGNAVCRFSRRPAISLVLFAVMIGLTVVALQRVPTGFIPEQDQGYIIVAVELPKGASLSRTDEVIKKAVGIIKQTPGTNRVVAFAGFSGATFATASNAGAMFVALKPFEERGPAESAQAIVGQLWGSLSALEEAQVFVIAPPAVRGLGNGGGFKMMVQDRSGRGLKALEDASWSLIAQANQMPEANQVFTTFSTASPQFFLDIDRTKAEMLNLPVENVFQTLQVYLGSAYVNDFNLFGRAYRVTAQADGPFRLEPTDILRLRARTSDGAMVPLGSVASLRTTTGADRVVRFNLFPATEVQGATPPGLSSGQTLTAMENLADTTLPGGMGYEWTELAYQQRSGGNAGLLVFPLSVLFVFLLLTAQYESWTTPIAILLIVPLCILFALLGIALRGMDNNILTQIGFIVLIGLASKNAILIVEFARQQETSGKSIYDAATNAAQLRLRPILMTSFAFILGVVPLMIASGPGAEMRQVLGTAVFSGMLGVTLVGLFLTPVFYVVIRRWVRGPIPSASPDTDTLPASEESL
ncbi:MAG: efflux RND transporter permease subunit [Lysobacterales bacterium]